MFPKPKRHEDMTIREAIHKQRCVVSNRWGAEGHHIITRKSGGPDAEWNLMPLSRIHHTECHQIGLNKFAEKYPKVKSWLIAHGWYFCEVRCKWINDLNGAEQ